MLLFFGQPKSTVLIAYQPAIQCSLNNIYIISIHLFRRMKQVAQPTLPQTHSTPPPFSSLGETELALEEETCWRTNLMLGEEEERVQERDCSFHRRTSFEENLVNDHLQLMKRILLETGLQLTHATLPQSDKSFASLREGGTVEVIDCNSYLLEEEKWQLRELILGNQENFSILLRLSPLFLESREELVYLLCKILQYVSTEVPCSPHQRKKPDPELLIEAHRVRLVEAVLNQQNVRVTTPEFFSNENEDPLMAIICVWLHAVLCIKNGIYHSDAVDIEGEEEEDSFFD